MKTVIEEDSQTIPLVLLAVMFLILLGAGLGMAYMGGFFSEKKVVASDKKITPPTAMIAPAH